MTQNHINNTIILATLVDIVSTTIHGVAGDEIASHIGNVGIGNIDDIAFARLQEHFMKV